MVIGIISDTHGLLRQEVKENLNDCELIIHGGDIGKVHIIEIDPEKENIDIIIYGHSHKSNISQKNGILYINPGSVGPRRFKLPTTMAKLIIEENKKYKVELITLIN